MKRAIVSVTNDITTDQRVFRTCTVLSAQGYEVLIIGRKLKTSASPSVPWKTRRFSLLFNKGFLFYAEYNLRLFITLLFCRASLFWANDLDTLLPNFWVARIRNKKLVYDSHEYFCHVPELISRPGVQQIWLRIERSIFPRLKHVITVNDSIAEKYAQEYGIRPMVIRNITIASRAKVALSSSTEIDFQLPTKPFLILQGAGINVDRGGEEAILSLRFQKEVDLVFLGSGDAWEKLIALSEKEKLEDRVRFIPRKPYEIMLKVAARALAGLSLDKPTNPNYINSLPNKIFDYIHAGIPVIATNIPEVSRIINTYNVGMVMDEFSPETLAGVTVQLYHDVAQESRYKNNLEVARAALNWENEKVKLEKMLQAL